MAENGIRTPNVPQAPLIEVLGHSDAGGGVRTLSRMSIGDFVNAVLGLANGDESAVASLQAQIVSAFEAIDRLSAAAASESEARQDADERLASKVVAEAEKRAEQNAAMLRLALAIVLSGSSPGASPAAFSGSTIGALEDGTSLNSADRLSTPLGQAYRIQGAGVVAPRATVAVDPDAIFTMRARYWRLADVLDPNNNAVDIGIQWLDADDGDAGRSLVHRESNLQRQDGPQTLTVRVPSEAGAQPVIAPPKGAVSWRPYVETYGADGATAISVLGATEVTFAGFYAPDVSALAARLGTIEGQIAAGLPFSTPVLPSYPVADLPKAGNRGRKAFARDGRAPNAAGALEAANAGTGVEVVDNGTKWVISGTNQAVQA